MSNDKTMDKRCPLQLDDKKMDSRCPRRLEEYPDTWCPLAVQRLKALRHADKELTEHEEAQLPGCPWGVNHQLANYCFFKLVKEHLPDTKNLSDMEIAHYCNTSTDMVRKTEKRAVEKIRQSAAFREIIEQYGDGAVMELDDQDINILDS